MNPLLSYLRAQAERRPLETARFVVGEVWRRGRLAAANGLHKPLPQLPAGGSLFPFLPAGFPARAIEVVPSPAREEILRRADGALRGEVEIFGECCAFGGVPDWHLDWVSGHRWPQERPGRNRILGAASGADIKRPWELSRFHHGLVLGQAFALTGELRYAKCFATHVSDWLEKNPAPRGIHWAMPMESAIRAVNWIAALALFSGAQFPPGFRQSVFAALVLHGRHIYSHREWNGVARGNHYLACVAGLVHLGVLFHDTPEGARWLAFGRRALREELFAQVGEDGVAHEGSSGYHIFVTELFLSAALVLARHDARRSGTEQMLTSAPALRAALAQSCGARFAGRLKAMFDFPAALCAGRDAPPLLGDSDDGRLLPWCRAGNPARHLAALGAALFHSPEPASLHHVCTDCLWWLGISPPHVAGEAPNAEPRAEFPQSGFYFFGSSQFRGSIRCGPLGVNGWANHAHCDQLSVELCYQGRPVLVDPGTYLYSGDPAARDDFRSTRAHNSPMVERQEQNRFWPGLLFRIVDDTRSRAELWEADEHRTMFAGVHHGYRRLEQKTDVRRVLVLRQEPEMLLVCDTVQGEGAVAVEWNFQLAPDIHPRPLRVNAVVRAKGAPHPFAWTGTLAPRLSDLNLLAAWDFGALQFLVWSPPSPAPLEAREIAGSVSARYGKREPAPKLRLARRAALPQRLAFVVGRFEVSQLREWGCQ